MKIYSGNISAVWSSLMDDVSQQGVHELPGYVACIQGEEDREDSATRQKLDEALEEAESPSTQTVANTIFPKSLWNRNEPRTELYQRYDGIWPRIKADPANKFGVYFRRIVHYENGPEPINQAETIIQNYQSGNHRRSAMQISIWNPARDLTNSRRRGFPCLQHLVVIPFGDNELEVTAFYATQTVFNKAYGNFLGLWRLGTFFAHSLGRDLSRVRCFVSIGMRGSIRRSDARALCD